MLSPWQQFLASRPTAPAAETLAADLSPLGLLRVDGADARTFLQGQLSTNLNTLRAEQGQFSSWNSPRGRVLTLLHVFLHDDAVHLALPHGLLITVMQGLGRYVLRAKVTLADASDTLVRIGLAGTSAPAQLARLGLSVPQDRWATATQDGITLMRLHGEPPRYVCHGSATRLIELAAALDGHVHWGQADDWALTGIRAGEPVIYPETSDQFVAQMLALDALGGIDFKKGCYTGQEIIARAHYRGRVKRHLARMSLQGSARFVPGTVIQSAGQNAGVLLDARPETDGTQAALAVMQEEQLDGTSFRIGGDAPVVVTLEQIYRTPDQ
ncbi:MAG TPA: folate-binding protein [Gammaproteobacteria bacterium]|nr:folate-binding protein [Gammaproteobacteria bacterium]